MADRVSVDLRILNVGCDAKPIGDVNVVLSRESLVSLKRCQYAELCLFSKKTQDFILAEACHLPLRHGSFPVVFSRDVIQQEQKPFSMLREMCRVTRRKVIVQCSHRMSRRGAGLHRFNFLDQDWFVKSFCVLGFFSTPFITSYNEVVNTRLEGVTRNRFQRTLLGRALRRFARTGLMKRNRVPQEMEVWARRMGGLTGSEEVKFVVVYNNPAMFRNCFASSPHVSSERVIAFHNTNNQPLSRFFNDIIRKHLNENTWFVFCHQDFVLQEELRSRLKGKPVEAIYGPIGVRSTGDDYFGMITQTNGTPKGLRLREDAPVQTLDEMCLIAHSEVFKQGLMFDDRFKFHFYGADLCMQAYTLGFDVLAMQMRCTHKSRTLQGDFSSPEYLSSRNMFREKWKRFLPVKTTTGLIE